MPCIPGSAGCARGGPHGVQACRNRTSLHSSLELEVLLSWPHRLCLTHAAPDHCPHSCLRSRETGALSWSCWSPSAPACAGRGLHHALAGAISAHSAIWACSGDWWRHHLRPDPDPCPVLQRPRSACMPPVSLEPRALDADHTGALTGCPSRSRGHGNQRQAATRPTASPPAFFLS